jgi:hypothetical protein
LAERWNGTRWAIQSTPKPAAAKDVRLSGVSCVSPRWCIAVGSYATAAGTELSLCSLARDPVRLIALDAPIGWRLAVTAGVATPAITVVASAHIVYSFAAYA